MSEQDKEKDKPQKPDEIHIFVDGKKIDTHEKSLTGGKIKTLAGSESNYQLFLEQPGDDAPIADNQTVTLKNGMHFYTVPPATLG